MNLGILKNHFWPDHKIPRSNLVAEPQAVTAPIRVGFEGRPVCLSLGPRRLWLFPDAVTRAVPDAPIGDWLLVDPDRYFTEIAGFARIRPGETMLIGRGNEDLDRFFGFPKSVRKRHLNLANDGGEIVLRPLDAQRDTRIAKADDAPALGQLRLYRLNNLRRVHEIFGGPFEPLAPEAAMATAEAFLEVLRNDPYRSKGRDGLPGTLLDLPDELAPIVVGDLHAQLDNLLTILCADRFLEGLRGGTAALVLLGDVVHREDDGRLEEMDSSLLMLDLIFKLKIRFPGNVFWLRGNHESFDESVGKAGVPQGQMLRRHAKTLRGKGYAKLLADCFDLLPYVLRSTDFIACHAGPVRGRTSLNDLINIRERPKLARELTWNRLRRPSRPAGYTKGDVKSFRDRLGVAKHTPLIVSHTPFASRGTMWTDVDDIKNHHVVYSAIPDKVAVMIRAGHEMVPLEYPVDALRNRVGGLALAS